MPLGSEVRERVRTFVPPGEEIRYLFPASVMTSSLVVVYALVVVTSAEILVLYTGFWSDEVRVAGGDLPVRELEGVFETDAGVKTAFGGDRQNRPRTGACPV